MNLGGQFAFIDDDGEPCMWRTVGLERQLWLSLMLTMVEVRAHARVLALDADPDFGRVSTTQPCTVG